MNIIDDLILILTSGSYKAMLQIGSLAFLEKQKIYPKAIIAISGGVPNALAYLQKKASRLPELWMEGVDPRDLYKPDFYGLTVGSLLGRRWPILGAPSILKTPRVLEDLIDREIDFEKILASPIIFWVGVMNLQSGKVDWVSNRDPGMTAQRLRKHALASMRIAVFFPPFEQLVDAGLINHCPIPKAVELGFTKIVVLNTLPFKLLPVSGLQSWSEINLRHDDIIHSEEVAGHRRFTERINQDVAALEALRKHWWIRVGLVLSRRMRRFFGQFSVANKRHIELCVVEPPPNLSIFRKEKKGYGTPTLQARKELLKIGEYLLEEQLKPFLRNQGILRKDIQ